MLGAWDDIKADWWCFSFSVYFLGYEGEKIAAKPEASVVNTPTKNTPAEISLTIVSICGLLKYERSPQGLSVIWDYLIRKLFSLVAAPTVVVNCQKRDWVQSFVKKARVLPCSNWHACNSSTVWMLAIEGYRVWNTWHEARGKRNSCTCPFLRRQLRFCGDDAQTKRGHICAAERVPPAVSQLLKAQENLRSSPETKFPGMSFFGF